jgi:uncharacterized membrane protein
MVIDYWKLILLTLAITELLKDDVIKNRKALPWVAIVISVVIAVVYAGVGNGVDWSAVLRGLSAGVITTGLYKLVKDYVRAMRRT